jgi:hypothetical protein
MDDRNFWEEQRDLPLRKRDGFWWASVGLPNVMLAIVVIAFAFALGSVFA